VASSSWEKRNARARAQGYASYYDYRRHRYGALPPSAAPVRGAELSKLRGHRSARDLQRSIEGGQVELLLVNVAQRDAKTGQLRRVDVLATLDDGTQVEYVLRGEALRRQKIEGLVGAIGDLGPDRVSTYTLKLLTPAGTQPDELVTLGDEGEAG
jgi:hypothetical protein